MRNVAATKVKMSSRKKNVNSTPYSISCLERVTRKFLEVSHCRHEKQQQRNVQQSVLYMQSGFLAN